MNDDEKRLMIERVSEEQWEKKHSISSSSSLQAFELKEKLKEKLKKSREEAEERKKEVTQLQSKVRPMINDESSFDPKKKHFCRSRVELC